MVLGDVVANEFYLEPSSSQNLSTTADGSVTGAFTGVNNGTTSATFTTSNSNDIIFVQVVINGTQTVSSIVLNSLTFKLIATDNNGSSVRQEIWAALSASPFTNQAVTVNVSNATNFSVQAYAFSNTNLIYPIDGLATISNTATSANPTLTITNNVLNSELIVFLGTTSNPTVTLSSGFSLLTTTPQGTNIEAHAENKRVTASGANAISITLNSSQSWSIIGIALVSGGNGSNCAQTVQPSVGTEWVIHNLYGSSGCIIVKSDGLAFASLVANPQTTSPILNNFIHVTNTFFVVIVNTSSSTGNYGYDGIQTK